MAARTLMEQVIVRAFNFEYAKSITHSSNTVILIQSLIE